MTFWNELIAMIEQLWQSFVDSGLAEKGADMIGTI